MDNINMYKLSSCNSLKKSSYEWKFPTFLNFQTFCHEFLYPAMSSSKGKKWIRIFQVSARYMNQLGVWQFELISTLVVWKGSCVRGCVQDIVCKISSSKWKSDSLPAINQSTYSSFLLVSVWNGKRWQTDRHINILFISSIRLGSLWPFGLLDPQVGCK